MIVFYNLKIVEILDADLKAVLTTHRKLRFYLCHFYQKVPRHLWSLHRALIFCDITSHAMLGKDIKKTKGSCPQLALNLKDKFNHFLPIHSNFTSSSSPARAIVSLSVSNKFRSFLNILILIV